MTAGWRERYEKAIPIAKKAGQLALSYFDKPLEVITKLDLSPVTIADKNTERLLRELILAEFPGDGFLGEEEGDTPNTTGFRWILDPIDGTRNFVRGVPSWGVLVGLEYKGELIAGVVDAPVFNHTYHALRGHGAYRNDDKIHVSAIGDLSKSFVFYSSLQWFAKAGREQGFLELVRRTDRQRGFGDWYGFMLMAQGSGEVMVEHGVHAWDIAALKPIVEEAGGRFTDWDGGFDLHRPDVIASNGLIHDEVLRLVAGTRDVK
jgi:histidinol-phosphatase